jgi:hypothetical protein
MGDTFLLICAFAFLPIHYGCSKWLWALRMQVHFKS